jgi:hypothetical protein
MRGFHCDNPIHEYSMPWTNSPSLVTIMLKLGSDLFLMGTSLPSHPNFRDSLLIPILKSCWDFYWICFEFILTTLRVAIYDHGIFLCLLRCSLIYFISIVFSIHVLHIFSLMLPKYIIYLSFGDGVSGIVFISVSNYLLPIYKNSWFFAHWPYILKLFYLLFHRFLGRFST